MILLVVGPLFAYAAGVYKWIDEKGITHYGEKPPAGQKAQEVHIQPSPPRPVTEQAQRNVPAIIPAIVGEQGKPEEPQANKAAPRRKQDVLGSIVLDFRIGSERAQMPPPSMQLTLLVEPTTRGPLAKYPIPQTDRDLSTFEADSYDSKLQVHTLNFTLSLAPGEFVYVPSGGFVKIIQNIEIPSEDERFDRIKKTKEHYLEALKRQCTVKAATRNGHGRG